MRRLISGRKGISVLPTVLILGGIIMNVAIAAALGVFLVTRSGFGDRLSAEALAAATAGIQDGKLRIARNQNFTTGPGGYDLVVGGRTAAISICSDLPECGGPGKIKISSVGSAGTHKRKIEALVAVSPLGGIDIQSVAEVPL